MVVGLGLIWWAFESWWAGPRRKREKSERRTRIAEERQKREIGLAEAKQRRLDQELRVGQQKWEEKLKEFSSKQKKANLEGYSRCTGSQFIRLLDWEQLEKTVAFILSTDGWTVQLTQSGADGGVDIRCARAIGDVKAEKLVVQVKHFSGGSVGAPLVRQLIGAATVEGASRSLMATSARFASGVTDAFNGIVELWDGDTLSRRIDSLTDEQFGNLAEAY